VDQFKRKFQVKEDIAQQPPLVSENYSDYPFMWYQNIGSMFFRFVIKHACDGQTDVQQELRSLDPATQLLRAVKTLLSAFETFIL